MKIRRYWLALAVLIGLAFLAATPQGLILQIQNGGSNIATWLSYGVINCSSGITCSLSGSTVTMTAGAAAAYNLGAINAIGASGASQTIVSTNGAVQSMTLSSGTVTISFTQPANAARVYLKITQAAGGNDTITWTSVKWPGGIVPVMTAAANAVDFYSCLLDGTNTYCTASQNFQ